MSEQVIWERTIDHDKIAERKQRFLKRFVGPAAAILIIVLVFAGLSNALGSLIVLGGIGLLWGNMVRFQSLSDQANPTMTFDGTRLKVGNRDVVVEEIKKYSTLATSLQTSVLGKHSRIDVGKVVFRLDDPGPRRDPELIEFGWPNMDETGLDAVTQALEPIIGERWVEPLDLVTEDELGRNRRRPGLYRPRAAG